MHLKGELHFCGFTVIEHSMYLKELLGKWRFKAKYDFSAEKLKNVLMK